LDWMVPVPSNPTRNLNFMVDEFLNLTKLRDFNKNPIEGIWLWTADSQVSLP